MSIARRARELYVTAGPLPIVALLAVLLGGIYAVVRARDVAGPPLVATIADLEAVHAGVIAGGSEVRGLRRLAASEWVRTDADGRARLRLDTGTTAVIDRATRLEVRAEGLSLEHGRLFVRGAPGAKSVLWVGDTKALVTGSAVALERTNGAAKIYSVDGEITVGEHKVGGGETASVAGGKVSVGPERAFDDWTGGLAAPWGALGPPRRAIGELWARPPEAATGDSGSPLTIRAHTIDARIAREVARTRTETTYFNGGSEVVDGDFRMAIPSGALVSRFAVRRDGKVHESSIALASRSSVASRPSAPVLEWAGEGWLRGHLPAIRTGENVGVIVEWVEWLSPKPWAAGRAIVQYRYPLVGEAAPPTIREFSALVDASASSPLAVTAGLGAGIGRGTVEIRRSDFRPTADFVVDVEMRRGVAPARLYHAPATDADEAGGTVVLRTELPVPKATDGVTLALVLDTSASVDPSLIEAGRAFVEAVLGTLGARDRVIALAADQTARALGPSAIGSLDAVRRQAITKALAAVAPGGASDLGRALEAGADALPPEAPAAMVIYIGDGWPTIGDNTVEAIQARLARRPGGAPRIGAVALGPLANRAALAALTRGSGPLLEVSDSADAASAAVELVGDALKPAVAGVEVDFGPLVDRVYPRVARTVVAGETLTAVGRVRGKLPSVVTLRWRDATGMRSEKRRVEVLRSVGEDDVRRRWAALRVEEIVLAGRGREAATDVALRAGLLTPWTGFRLHGARAYAASSLETRVLDLASNGEGFIGPVLSTPSGAFGTLFGNGDGSDDGEYSEASFTRAVVAAAERVIDEAGPAVRACRDSRAALRPELTGALEAAVEIDGQGRAKNARVRGMMASSEDAALNRCVEVVLRGLRYPQSGGVATVRVEHLIQLPPSTATLRARKCSPTSDLAMPLRRGVWRERLAHAKAWEVYLEAKRQCELPSWTDRRALLELLLLHDETGSARLDTARHLDRAGETDAATLLRREAVRRAATPQELATVRNALVGEERAPVGVFEKRYRAAANDPARLAVVRQLLTVAPHDSRLRGKLVALLEALGKKRELVDEIRRIRLDPFADAALLADSATALRRAGEEREARRAFGELVERAPADPWVRAFLGDRLRNEGWYDDAVGAYAALETLAHDDPGAIMRLSLAHAGAGRLDIAQRLLGRVAHSGGRTGDPRLSSLASHVAQVLVATARTRPALAPEDAERLVRVALSIPRDADAQIALVRAPPATAPITVTLLRGPAATREERKPEAAAESLGLYALRLDGPGKLLLSRRAELPPARALPVRIDVLLPDAKTGLPRLVSKELELSADGKTAELDWNGAGF